MTLVAGRQNGLYPYIYDDEVYEFAGMGIVPIENITIDWPDKKHRRSSAPIANIQQVAMDDEDHLYMQTKRLIGLKSSYKPGHDILKEHTICTMTSEVSEKFRGRTYIFATLSNGNKIRCGKSLEAKITPWLHKQDDGAIPQMEFTDTTKRRVQGYPDILVQ
ncbi:hypothetical protein BGX24_004164 [Mortierella sp. AD032]|nr:hypothetical protein BGX24_004164 [Mortierella sp. AD032]